MSLLCLFLETKLCSLSVCFLNSLRILDPSLIEYIRRGTFPGKLKELIMGSTKFDVEKFICNNDFGLWRVKMRALLVQQGLIGALKGSNALPDTLTEDQK